MGNKHELKLISEPEAAAVYTFKAIQPRALKVGDNFIVCDAGEAILGPLAWVRRSLFDFQVEAP
jgi:hypothetical protein